MAETTYRDEQTQIAKDAGAGNPPDTVETLTDRLHEIAREQARLAEYQEKLDAAKGAATEARKAYDAALARFLGLCARLTGMAPPLPLFDGPESDEMRLQQMLLLAGTTVPLNTIIAWTPAQRAEARQWTADQITANQNAKPGYTVSVRWPDFMDDAVSEIDT